MKKTNIFYTGSSMKTDRPLFVDMSTMKTEKSVIVVATSGKGMGYSNKLKTVNN